MDSSTGKFTGIFDLTAKTCKPFNAIDCPSKSLFNPDEQNKSVEKAEPKMKLNDFFQTESNFSCFNRKNGYYESEWCNVFFRCVNGKRIDTRCSSGTKLNGRAGYDLWWEYQNSAYDQSSPILFGGSDGSAKCEWPCKVKCNKSIWTETGSEPLARVIRQKDIELNPECVVNKTAIEIELEDTNPSGFTCEDRQGIFKDPLFCNIYHDCINKERKTFVCTLNGKESEALFDADKKQCVPKAELFSECKGIIYESKFLYVPAYKNLPVVDEQCTDSGIFRAQEENVKYCDLYYWCDYSGAKPIYFYCDAAFYTNDYTLFDIENKRCELHKTLDCPNKPNRIYMDLLKINDLQENKIAEEKKIEEVNTEIPSGYQSLDSTGLFKHFKCPVNAAGFYPDPEFCDVFHYCFSNAQHHTFACDSVSENYQLWWNFPKDQIRQNVKF